MKTTATIVDYGVGNILSLSRAIEHCGARAELAQDARSIASAEHLVLPGVGSFKYGMEQLRQRGFVDPIMDFVDTGRPFLGVCLGMQLMFEASDEFGHSDGLGLLPGEVIPLPPVSPQGLPNRIPHISWNTISPPDEKNWRNTILSSTLEGSYVYFVHSYYANAAEEGQVIAETPFNGMAFCSVAGRNNLIGTQFHPEKSGVVGLKILDRFLSL